MNENIKKHNEEYSKIVRKINQLNEEIVSLLNQIEKENNFEPFKENGNKELKELWEKVSNARNYNIYE